MKDSSKFFKRPEGFITKVNVEGEEIVVTFSKSSKSKKPEFRYVLNKDGLDFCEERLQNQYREVYNDRKRITDNSISTILAILGGVIGYGFLYCYMNELTSLLPILFGVGSLDLIGIVLNESVKSGRRREIATRYECIELQDEFEQAAEEEENITRNISKNGQFLLDKQRQLKEDGYTDNVYNTFFIDEASIDDLREISAKLKIYLALKKPVELARKTRTRKKETNRTNSTNIE